MKKDNKFSFQEELANLLDKHGVSEFKGNSFDEVLLQTVKLMLEKMLSADIDEHLSYDKTRKYISENTRNEFSHLRK